MNYAFSKAYVLKKLDHLIYYFGPPYIHIYKSASYPNKMVHYFRNYRQLYNGKTDNGQRKNYSQINV